MFLTSELQKANDLKPLEYSKIRSFCYFAEPNVYVFLRCKHLQFVLLESLRRCSVFIYNTLVMFLLLIYESMDQ